MNFKTFNLSNRTVYPVYLAGFHDTRCAEGELFFDEERAEQYCSDKVIYVQGYSFYTLERAEDFVNLMAKRTINHCRALGVKVNLDDIECPEFRKIVEKVINEH